MKTKKITSLLLITFQSASLFSVVQFTTSCANTDEIIAHPSTQAEAYIKVAQYLYDNKSLSLQYINAMAPSLDATDISYTTYGGSKYTMSYWSSNYVYMCESYNTGSTTSNCLVFNLVRRIDENNALYTFGFKWSTFNFGPYKTNHNIYVDYIGEWELV